jgi:hypothetical protein
MTNAGEAIFHLIPRACHTQRCRWTIQMEKKCINNDITNDTFHIYATVCTAKLSAAVSQTSEKWLKHLSAAAGSREPKLPNFFFFFL